MLWFALIAVAVYVWGTQYRLHCLKERVQRLERAAGMPAPSELDPDRRLSAA